MNKLKEFKEKLERVEPRDIFAGFQFVLAYPVSRLYKRLRPNLWLICEDENEARDNGYWLYKYICENHPEQDVVYAINKFSPDYKKVKSLGQVIQTGTLRHWIYYLAADKNISSQKGSGKPNAAICYALEIPELVKNKRAFLQHGITKDDMPWLYYNSTKMQLFVCGAKREYEYIKEKFGYPEGYVQYIGFPRFDKLHDYTLKKNQILVMPSWREWIGTPTSKSKEFDDLTSFKNTEYYKKWNELLNSKKLADILEKNNLELIFFPHRNMQRFIEDFQVGSNRITLANWKEYDVQTLLKESAFLITDYSSIFMDFAYMRKPMAYYQFDYDKFRKGQYGEGYFSYKEDGFGPICYTLTEILDYLEKIAETGFENPTEYKDKEEAFFPLYDTDNCERNYQAIKEM